MATKKKLLQAAAGSAGGGAGLNVEELFSTYLWDGTGSFGERTIANGIDLSGEGGLVWVKDRENAQSHGWYDTERGATKYLQSNATSAEATVSLGVTSFKTNGFGVDYSHNNADYASWTFRKAPKFFDVVTYTGDGTSGRSISHNLGCDVGMIIIKNLSRSSNWAVWHRGFTSISYGSILNETYGEFTNGSILTATPTSTTVSIKNPGYDGAGTNHSGDSYVMYLFAHNDGDGEFGPTGDQDIIKCGVVSHTQSNGFDSEVNLGFEPQWLLIKNSNNAGYAWAIFDTMRGWTVQTEDNYLTAESSDAEGTTSTGTGWIDVTPTGFKIQDAMFGTGEYIYIAIRRGPMAVPESATDVFAIDTYGDGVSAPRFKSGFPVDMFFYKTTTGGNNYLADRLRGVKLLKTDSTAAETTSDPTFDYMNGVIDGSGVVANIYGWMWKRAPSFFDVVAYTGNGTAGRTVSHNLGVAPEMMWVKKRNASGSIWAVFHKDVGATKFLRLNTTDGEATLTALWNDTAPTSDVFTVGTGGSVNGSGSTFIAYLFASLDGVSKVGSYDGDSTTGRVIDCGFTSGARFVLIKRTDGAGDWYVFDTERGITTSVAYSLSLNSTAAQNPTGSPTQDYHDRIDPHSSGFIVNHTAVLAVNESGQSYIFYAIA